MKSYLNAAEVAKTLKTDRATVVRRIEQGKIPSATKPRGERQWRIPMDAVTELLKQHEGH
jgi:excisionase family DNA binding protein